MSEEDVSLTPENKPYVTVMHGVGIFQAVIMKWNQKGQEYCLGPLAKARKTQTHAEADAKRMAEASGLEIR